jgi:hypothetical protein
VVGDSLGRIRPDPASLDPPDQSVLLPARIPTNSAYSAGSDDLILKEPHFSYLSVRLVNNEVSSSTTFFKVSIASSIRETIPISFGGAIDAKISLKAL